MMMGSGICFAILGRKPGAFQIGKISVVEIGKFVIGHNYVILVNKKQMSFTHTLPS